MITLPANWKSIIQFIELTNPKNALACMALKNKDEQICIMYGRGVNPIIARERLITDIPLLNTTAHNEVSRYVDDEEIKEPMTNDEWEMLRLPGYKLYNEEIKSE